MRVVIFDFDGTIADSFSTVINIAYQLTKREQLADIEQAKIMRDNSMGLMQAVKALNIPKWQWPLLLGRGKRLMTRYIHQVPMIYGMEEVLKHLNEEHVPLYIISTNSRANVERFLMEKGLLGYFNKVYGGAGLFNKAAVIKKVLRQEGISTTEAIYVGDEVRDIVAAKQLDMPCVAVSWGYNGMDLLLQYSPMVVVTKTSQLEKVLVEWSKQL